jgi:hypothetical protein
MSMAPRFGRLGKHLWVSLLGGIVMLALPGGVKADFFVGTSQSSFSAVYNIGSPVTSLHTSNFTFLGSTGTVASQVFKMNSLSGEPQLAYLYQVTAPPGSFGGNKLYVSQMELLAFTGGMQAQNLGGNPSRGYIINSGFSPFGGFTTGGGPVPSTGSTFFLAHPPTNSDIDVNFFDSSVSNLKGTSFIFMFFSDNAPLLGGTDIRGSSEADGILAWQPGGTPFNPIPEPSSALMVGIGIFGLGGSWVWRRWRLQVVRVKA